MRSLLSTRASRGCPEHIQGVSLICASVLCYKKGLRNPKTVCAGERDMGGKGSRGKQKPWKRLACAPLCWLWDSLHCLGASSWKLNPCLSMSSRFFLFFSPFFKFFFFFLVVKTYNINFPFSPSLSMLFGGINYSHNTVQAPSPCFQNLRYPR